MAHYHDEYSHWPFLTQEEFELAGAFFDQRYIQAKLGPSRKHFKLRSRRTMTTGNSHIEILRLLQLPDDKDDLSAAFGRLSGTGQLEDHDMDLGINEDADEEALRPATVGTISRMNSPPRYAIFSLQPYVIYEIHLHPTYRMPTLWFTLHDLPTGEPAFDLDAVYRYLVPPEHKSILRAAGFTGGISAAPHPVTDIPSFFIHPCQTKEAMEAFDCPMKDYLMTWIGLVGGAVGLWVPPEMAQEEIDGMHE